MRVGIGYDVHKFARGRPLVLGGVTIPFERGLLGWSDADALVHAIIDALLGAAALGDIGGYFPPGDPAYENASSISLLRQTADLLAGVGWRITNVDSVVLAERPVMKPFIDGMRRNISQALSIDMGQVSIKGKTSDGLGFVGRSDGIAAHAAVLLEKVKRDDEDI